MLGVVAGVGRAVAAASRVQQASRSLLGASGGVSVAVRRASDGPAVDSHPDFARKSKVQMGAPNDAIEFIDKAVKSDPVVLFMKGTPAAPQCGFSNAVVTLLRAEGAKFAAYNVLASDALREGVKRYSNWPTIPQLYISGEFVGGCDIATQMHKTGELAKLLKKAGVVQAASESK